MDMPSTHLSLLGALLGDPGRDRAWATFHHRYAPLLRTWCARWGLHQADVDDLTQDILLKVFHNLPTYDRGRGRFRAWLAICASIAGATGFWPCARPIIERNWRISSRCSSAQLSTAAAGSVLPSLRRATV